MNSLQMRDIESTDYHKNMLILLKQLTTVNEELIDHNNFTEFVDNLNDHHKILVIEDLVSGNIIASATLFIEKKIIHGLKNVGHIEDVVVDNKYRKLGLGKILITELVNYGKQNNCYKIILNCDESNVPFYEKCGFKRTESEMSYYF